MLVCRCIAFRNQVVITATLYRWLCPGLVRPDLAANLSDSLSFCLNLATQDLNIFDTEVPVLVVDEKHVRHQRPTVLRRRSAVFRVIGKYASAIARLVATFSS